ncbi:mediator of RNA polymerase II transcription subunit 15 [Drosophila ficusphila]|uniref:mediator of RNA polymerase II transcription subunit 15 n=1 Tax=Drosophila ficusphila TaxID=30025 RepID=UPI0007E85A3A|nr:mediator of RNA polymerase II transcription subunit 15 [Drosophila ficusphila]
MKLPVLLLLIQSWALVAGAIPARHWRRAPSHGVFNVDVYAYNKPRMNLAFRQGISSRSVQDPPPMDHLLHQISQHSRRSTDQRSHYRNLDQEADVEVLPMAGQIQASELNKTIEEPAINMQLMQLQMNSVQHAPENLYSNEFHVQKVGTKKIVQLNTLASEAERKPVAEEVMAQRQQKPEQPEQQEPMKVKLTLPELHENNAAETEAVVTGQNKNRKDEDVPASNATLTAAAAAGESPAGVKKTMAPSGTIIDMASTGMQQLVSQPTAENAGDTSTKAQSGRRKNKDETRQRPPRPKTKRKQTPTGAKASNETDTKMTASQVVTTPISGAAPAAPPAAAAAPESNPIRRPSPGPLRVKQPEISTHRPLTTNGKNKNKSKGKGKDKRRQGTQRRPANAAAMEEEIETTTNWWQILPYAEIRKFLNTIYDTIADDVDDERATDDV